MDLDIALTMRHDHKRLDGLVDGVSETLTGTTSVRCHFGEKGLVDLTLAAVAINA
ncbi:hypothetical protein HF289_14480 [Acidithiobacillus ferrooxidans]|jgi:hypothetical protein|uniref:hypothetical protein n=1 Tax=Acidithiobacillus ferrooxidans TaxID=920 RepID=UPI000AA94CCA|nr:hypothetical protein [Acidithiobacillus ferrooxidans]MBU2858017.1 hypothetical protein [Acidithiobacillus ferrooxidans]MBU2858927.1 hypothetical protein [Acidithiobacillus ferrooxidans]MCR2829306.1 hypothetical protein [Acidithiobacillus ferrooxidans]